MKKCTYWVSTLVSLILFLAPAFNAAHAKGSVPTSRGYTDYIDLGAPDALTFPNKGSFTVEAWVCVAFTRDKAMVYSKNSGRSSGNHTTLNYTFGLTQGGQSMGARYANIWREALLPKPVMPGNWHHLAYSFDNGKLTFVFDGIEMGTESFPFNYYSTHTIEIGGYASGYDFWGSMADVRVWNTARTALQIRGDMNRRLTGTEAGLVGYWPLDEGSGPTVFDRTVNSNNGTWAGSHEWVTADDLDLALFTLAHPVTGSTRFTCTNEVAIVALSIPPDCDQYQITLSDESINPSDWLSTNTAPGLVQFDRPTVDTNMTFTAWYTNSTASVALRREEASIFYTTVAPVSSVRVALTREQVLPNGVIIQGTDLDDGSTGGAVNGTNLAIVAWTALAVQPGDDSTVTEDFVTLEGVGDYPLQLLVMNEAGSVATSVATSSVTVADYRGTNEWTGKGLTDRWHDGGNWSAGVPEAGQDVGVHMNATVILDVPTPELTSFSMTDGSLVFQGWDVKLAATDVMISGGTVTAVGAFADFGISNRVWISAANNFTVTAPGKIDVSGKGYASMMGPEKGGERSDSGSGGGHGGRGGIGYVRGGGTYDSVVTPVLAGSGGFYAGSTPGGSGGGVVKLEAGGIVAIHGLVAANGENGSGHSGGGAGGTINIAATTFTGNADGQFQVKGGNRAGSYGGGGGGGRIAVVGDVDPSMAVQFSASPGESRSYDTTCFPWESQWGTLYIADDNFLATLPADNQLLDVILHIGTVNEWVVPGTLTLTKNRFRLAPEGFTLNVDGNLEIGAGVDFGIEGSMTVGGDLLLTDTGRLSVYADPTNGMGDAYGAVVEVMNDIVIGDTSWLQLYSHPTNGGSVLLRMRDLKITGTSKATAGITATARGFAAFQGPGHGTGASGGGGSYGGEGDSSAGLIYGNPYAPMLSGSGGGGSGDGPPLYAGSGYGGGLIRMEARRDVILGNNSQILANGGTGIHQYLTGSGGSGGGILIACQRFTGVETARLSAQGAGGYSGRGGGGRIAVWEGVPTSLQAKLFAGTPGSAILSETPFVDYLGAVDVSGGSVGGEAGTVWFITAPPSGLVIIVR